ncbi:helix-turn-helix domain-containing protein [Pseudomonas sp. GV071]|uniref:helix-turn-helix domain-containing protein n=1 Tax=Pseudomonas sp. GV071 TaxID=2135754 RepID=UPI000D380473|nr:helix-turn-helix domain-containing protein [Pseudomonas sp. GV071]PTQ70479.1 helix-turn-helix protein [Pseudomonas sp. GV071]
MANKTSPLLPATTELLAAFGERLRLARERRKLTAAQVAARAGMAPLTLRNVERGADGVTMGAYLAVMQVLGLEADLALLAAADDVGRQLQDATLVSRRKTSRPRPAAKTTRYPAAEPRPMYGVRESSGLELIDDYRAHMDALFDAQDDN